MGLDFAGCTLVKVAQAAADMASKYLHNSAALHIFTQPCGAGTCSLR